MQDFYENLNQMDAEIKEAEQVLDNLIAYLPRGHEDEWFTLCRYISGLREKKVNFILKHGRQRRIHNGAL